MDNKRLMIPIAADHGGFEMKEAIIGELKKIGYTPVNMGTFASESVDYPDLIHPLAKEINEGKYLFGIIICGSGNGAQMVANKYPDVRAALCWSEEITKLARRHNDANILSLPGRFITHNLALKMVKIFLETEFEGGRHTKRVNKINQVR
ncbi:MAG: RpiB/LacA/LacB family sugar-phosphate isomerase [Bacteroidales bacterium]|nr:RpiB/LacA/LacB family sugar-phosphate isomerase [Bacteroidales bacterium]